jgi:hypothetical protein
MAKSKVVLNYKLEHTNKELDGRLTSALMLALLLRASRGCPFQTFSSTPSLALLILPLDDFALSHFHAPLPHMLP